MLPNHVDSKKIFNVFAKKYNEIKILYMEASESKWVNSIKHVIEEITLKQYYKLISLSVMYPWYHGILDTNRIIPLVLIAIDTELKIL